MPAQLAVTKETRAAETRVAATPDSVKKLVAMGFAVSVETGAGAGASFPDADYLAAGATIAPTAESALADADVVLKVRAPTDAKVRILGVILNDVDVSAKKYSRVYYSYYQRYNGYDADTTSETPSGKEAAE